MSGRQLGLDTAERVRRLLDEAAKRTREKDRSAAVAAPGASCAPSVASEDASATESRRSRLRQAAYDSRTGRKVAGRAAVTRDDAAAELLDGQRVAAQPERQPPHHAHLGRHKSAAPQGAGAPEDTMSALCSMFQAGLFGECETFSKPRPRRAAGLRLRHVSSWAWEERAACVGRWGREDCARESCG